MAVWVVRAGRAKTGDFEDEAFGSGVALINFGMQRDLSEFSTYEAVRDHLLHHAPALYEYTSIHKAAAAASQVWNFYKCIGPGDTVLIPRSHPKVQAVAVGRVQDGAPYQIWNEDFECLRVYRPVDWQAVNIPYDDFDPAFLRTLNIGRTVFEPNFIDADAHVKQVLQSHLATV